jgi:hypothetical protein
MDQKDPTWTCVSRLKECAFVLSSSALDYGKLIFFKACKLRKDLSYEKSTLIDQKDSIWTCVPRLKECAFVLSSSALDYGKRPFTINSFCAVQYRLSRKKRKKFCKPSMQLTEESVALPKFPFVFFRLFGDSDFGT